MEGDKTLAMNVANPTFMLDKLGQECGPVTVRSGIDAERYRGDQSWWRTGRDHLGRGLAPF
jgi:hypothetical protein